METVDPSSSANSPASSTASPSPSSVANSPSPSSPSATTKSNGAVVSLEDLTKLRSCNACKRCMRRELKRASRKKKTNDESQSMTKYWCLDRPKRAIIFNSKEIVSFPRPVPAINGSTGFGNAGFGAGVTAGGAGSRTIELPSRIICYCRHHQEPNGFRLFFVLKNNEGEVVGRCLSDAIMIMDRKKSSGKGLVSETQTQSQTQGVAAGQRAATGGQLQLQNGVGNGQSPKIGGSTTGIGVVKPGTLISGATNGLSPTSFEDSATNTSDFTTTNLSSTNHAPVSQFGSMDFGEDGYGSGRPTKRKRPWSPQDTTASISSNYFTNGTTNGAEIHLSLPLLVLVLVLDSLVPVLMAVKQVLIST
ncbi:unnamed protein product [Ambrosiozyma monospora]|uniref:Unnamed protein product n=1 Tax=Ambrosiozyma monospora TaxID=43982 RepID=A0ACB5TXW1_AMBMO|nr:unnamed protein product [Ambrosiozyma monospora]